MLDCLEPCKLTMPEAERVGPTGQHLSSPPRLRAATSVTTMALFMHCEQPSGDLDRLTLQR